MPGLKIREEEKVPETVDVQKTMESMINLVDGGQWSSSKEAKGQVTLLAYFATF